ncbi:hypothetical protein ACFV4K_05935 [Nocardia sp. NPDC059764]|uniref:hypothetical protein n=1 Tax=Nocardia sp. NPDC059764 TaxID=3346939 RepID=UPI0036590C93
MSSNNQWSVQAIIDRIEREKRQTAASEQAIEEPAVARYSVRGLWSCYSDPGKLTATQAHTAMQLHLGCGIDTCLVRSRARDALVAAGRMVLDKRAVRSPAEARRSLSMIVRAAIVGCSALFLGGHHVLR